MTEATSHDPVIIGWPKIEKLVAGVDLVGAMEEGFVADLTVVAVQDVQIADAVFRSHRAGT
ncbi:MAG: hypothetical protein ACE5GX_15990 [Thermoanaerobaculia bacterium]